MKIAVTGGAGFIGSHLVEELQERGHEVLIVDNFSSGRPENVPQNVELLKVDIKNAELEPAFEECEAVFHFAANPKVNTFPDDRSTDFQENLEGTRKVLEAVESSGVQEFVFASSSVVYGEDAPIPTPEDYRFDPISMYGATKAGGEHLVRVYGNSFDVDVTVLRYANIVGGRNKKGVVYDFVHKLKENPEKLKILGNGKQRKSYLHVEDSVEATLEAWKNDGEVYNIGSEDSIDVDRIANIVSDAMGLDPEYSYTGGDRGWTGDVPEMRLDISKLQEEGWKPSNNSSESVRKTAEELI